MALIQRPTKTGGNTEYTAEVAAGFRKIKASEVDGDFDTIYNEFNGGIDQANIADQGVGTAELTNEAVTTDKIDTGATQRGLVASSTNLALSTITTVETDIVVCPSITTRGGPVESCGVMGIRGSAGGGGTIIFRLKQGVTIIVQWEADVAAGADYTAFVPLTCISTAPAAGSYVYKVTGQCTGDASISVASVQLS